jgi:two-component system cell cycle sensor histidine kinase/response regulator CckA
MPGMRGPDLARLIRETHPDLPVLFVSGYAGEVAPEGLEPGHVAFLAKPFTADELTGVVRDLLRNRGASAGRRAADPSGRSQPATPDETAG